MITHKELFKQLYTKPTKNFNIYEASGHSASKAAYILIIAHILPPIILTGIWLISTIPYLESLSFFGLIIKALGLLSLLLGILFVTMSFAAFGFWGTVITSGRGSDNDSLEYFSPGKGYMLGWLRWLLQLVMIGGMLFPILLTANNIRMWQVLPNPENRIGLTAKTVQLPAKVPAEWKLKYAKNGPSDWPASDSFSYSMTYTLPEDSEFTQVKDWVTTANWQEVFGSPVRKTVCDVDIEDCTLYFAKKPNVSATSDLQDKFWYKLETHFSSSKIRPDKSVRIVVRAIYLNE